MDEPTYTRQFQAELTAGDGRTIEARIVPYNTAATVADPPEWRPYQEMFVPGAFERQVNAPNRVRIWLNFEHEQGIRGLIGYGTELHDRADALYGTFHVQPNTDGDKALDLVKSGMLTGVSMEFASKAQRMVDGVMRRLRAHIDKVSLCRDPAYADAQVVAVRRAPMWQPETFNPALAARLEQLKIPVPETLRVS
jgi:HK97 family phage prohead protease